MISKNFVIVNDGVSSYPGVRDIVESDKLVSYPLTYDDVHTIDELHPLERVALRLWGESKFWFVIADLNPLRAAGDWRTGDVIRLPKENPMTLIRKVQAK